MLFPGIPQPLRGSQPVLHPLKGDPTGDTLWDREAGAKPALDLNDAPRCHPQSHLQPPATQGPSWGASQHRGTWGPPPPSLSRAVPCTGPAGHTPPMRSAPPAPTGKTALVSIDRQGHRWAWQPRGQGRVSSCLRGSSQVGHEGGRGCHMETHEYVLLSCPHSQHPRSAQPAGADTCGTGCSGHCAGLRTHTLIALLASQKASCRASPPPLAPQELQSTP